jgi:division protein CdvB (Snf7/Vps24/ESCRT-III family)
MVQKKVYVEMHVKSKWVKSEQTLEDKNRANSNIDISIKYSIPLKPRVDAVRDQVNSQVSKLDIILNEIKTKDYETFRSTLSSVKGNDTLNSRISLSNLLRIRKLIRIVSLSKVVFENLNIKLSTVSSIVDLISVLSPGIALVKNVRSSLISYIPESKYEIGSISDLIGGILVDAGQIGSYIINFETANEKASYLINEASLIAEQKIKEEFPDLPDFVSTSTKD